jgi:branched-chain amino acid transport system substrate-binding protein
MSRKVTRRKFMAGTAAGAALATFKFPTPAIAQAAPFKIGLLTVKTGPLAQGGIQMEQGVVTFLKEKKLYLRRPQGRVHLDRYRRQSGRRQDQGARADRA